MPNRHFLRRDYLHIVLYMKFLLFVSLVHQISIYLKVTIVTPASPSPNSASL